MDKFSLSSILTLKKDKESKSMKVFIAVLECHNRQIKGIFQAFHP